MTDLIAILQHPTRRMAKVWTPGGIAPYDDAKYFTLKERAVDGIAELSALLAKLEPARGCCIIRGRYVGDELAAARDPEHKDGKVRRVLATFEDQALHAMLVEVDNFEPLLADPVLEPTECIEEYVATCLPSAFHGVTYHWQLSNSAGAPGNEARLKAHIWFWLATPYTSAQLRAWSKTLPPDTLDASVLNPVQIHYTAAPEFEDGVADPVPVRSGLVEGLLDDTVDLVIDEDVLSGAAVAGGETRQSVLRNALDSDPIVKLLEENGLVKSRGVAGQLNITCPCAEDHSSAGGVSSTVYYPPNTGGYAKGAFVCLHDHCRDRPQREFMQALGYDPVLDEFTDLSAGEDLLGEEDAPQDAGPKVPEAQHLVTDLANAERIMRHYGRRLIVATDRWFAWTGTHWTQDNGAVYASAVKLSRIIAAEAEDYEQKALAVCKKRMGDDISMKWLREQAGDKKLAEELPEKVLRHLRTAGILHKWAARSEMRSTIDAALYLAKQMLAVAEDQLDRDPWALNCLNGTIDLRTGKLRAHNPSDYITHCAPVDYDPAARAPLWEATLAKVTMEDTQGDRPVAAFLKRWFGYCATGSVREQKFVVHYGNGRNGKSTILDTVGEVLNGYAGTAAPGLLVSNSKERHPTEVADLFGKRMVTAHETGEGGQLREDFVKQATGSDKLKARYMRADFFEFAPTHKLQLLTNHKPVIKGQDEGIWRRVLLVPYLARFGTPAEVDTNLATHERDTRVAEHLTQEKAAILTWIVEGAVEWFRDGLNPPAVVLAASREYQSEQDRIGQFVAECCEVGAEFTEVLSGTFGGLYPAYKAWAVESGWRPLSKPKFTNELKRVIPYAQTIASKEDDGMGGRRNITQVAGIRLLETT